MAALPTTPPQFHFGAALDWTQREYGFLINEVQSQPPIPITTPTSPFVSNNGDRLGLIFINTTPSNMFVGLDSTVSSFNGILLVANGGSVTMNVRNDMTLPTRAWYGFSVSSPQNLTVIEIIAVRTLPAGYVPGV